MGFVDEKQSDLSLIGNGAEQLLDGAHQFGGGVRWGWSTEFQANLTQQLRHSACGCDDREHYILGRMQRSGGGPEAGTLARAHIACDHGGRRQLEGVLETPAEGFQAWKWIKLLYRDVLGEGLAGEAKGVGESDHLDSSFSSKRLPPRY